LRSAARGVAEVRLSPKARADLAEIDAYGAKTFGDEVAAGYARGFAVAFVLLSDHPQIGPLQPRLGHKVRVLSHRRHRIFYEVTGEFALILRVFHHSRDVKRSLLK
jgi:toxin ParE1/3/4